MGAHADISKALQKFIQKLNIHMLVGPNPFKWAPLGHHLDVHLRGVTAAWLGLQIQYIYIHVGACSLKRGVHLTLPLLDCRPKLVLLLY